MLAGNRHEGTPLFCVFDFRERQSFFFAKNPILYADRITKIWEPSEIPELRLT